MQYIFFFLMIRHPPRSTQSRSSAASDVYKRQEYGFKAMIDAVKKITHIAPAEADGKMLDVLVKQEGIIEIPARSLGLCGGFLKLKYAITTEVYPDSPKVDDANCDQAQVVTITSGLQYIIDKQIKF
eukprot:TRINITY_DN4433_c0_g1_i1.p1 TRINITY_DN4433_c0_g1~~TRINITY_DN4433_c0_g1_i1.p1  ORF type:complete len:127 (-),score=85.23 TRINITY_DN4433_c0_g1_i1:338-718(-)